MNRTAKVPGRLVSIEEASRIIQAGRGVSIAGDEAALRQLPKGLWIGGTIPYFMSDQGGLSCRDRVFVNELPAASGAPGMCTYDVSNIDSVCMDAPANGFSVLIVPAFSEIHQRFAHDAPEFDGMYMQPLVGWVAGAHLDDLANSPAASKPKTVFGPTGEFNEDLAVAMHVEIAADRAASIEIINLFEPGNGPTLRFHDSGFVVKDVEVDGQLTNFAHYLKEHKIDTRLPLVADYCGAFINVSVQAVDVDKGEVKLYAPVFPELQYHIANPVPSYAEAFQQVMPGDDGEIAFCCNCILNYLYGELEGQQTGRMHGPMTFGEIAYQLVNQTLVYLRVS
ncbi:DUF6976 family protein [Oceanobacter mangrovi]|uniref:DUF6976 family protein n=1 Tax=Oceanobacter mangrovi TaxID=2862510 RepID=UPI001C8D308D|nr:hypothetical protein [Oceanobacter mangrovi]